MNRILSILLAAAALAVFAGRSYGQDEVDGEPMMGENGDMGGETTEDEPFPGDDAPPAAPPTDMGGSAVDEEIRRVDAFEETTPYDESPQETFYQLAEDFIFLSEIGGRGPGRVPIWPREAVKLGPIEIFPYLEGRIGWTNNLFERKDGENSWFAQEGGGFTGRFLFAGGRGNITFGGDYRHFDYFCYGDDSFSEWTGGVGAGYSFANGLWFRGGVKWEHLVNPVDAQFAGRLERDQWYPYIEAGFDNAFGNKINVEFGVQYFNADFENNAFATANRNEWNAHVKVSYPVFRETTRVYIRYDYFFGDRESERINDLDNGHEVSGGLEGTIPVTRSERLTGFIGIGVRRDIYDEPREFQIGSETITTDRDERETVLTVHAALRYLAGARTSLDLRALRTLQFSPASNYSVVNRIDFTATHNCLRNLVARAGVFYEFTDQSRGGSYNPGEEFTRYGAGIGARYMLLPNADLDLSIDWANRDTDKEEFDTDTLSASLGFTYYFGTK